MATTNNSLNNTSSTSIASTTQTFTISNSDNTGTSDAVLQLSVGGSGTSGDAYNSFVVSGANTWTSGIDNSNNDNFVISANASLGTTNTFVMTTGGSNTLPLTSAYTLYPSGTLTDVTGNGSYAPVVYDTTLFDQNSNNTTTTFTAPETGKYILCATFLYSGITAGMWSTNFQFNASNRTFIDNIQWPGKTMDVNTKLSQYHTKIIDMDAGDTVTLTSNISNGAKVVDILGGTSPMQSIKSGFLAC
ncbi:hypothetical protein [Methylobacter sp.]|uniref:hypothetical protein n=1 Tax=Methylobacter sp. TaxID=2051955 RepID=UPI003DA3D5B9